MCNVTSTTSEIQSAELFTVQPYFYLETKKEY